jgi:hypothetical protein
MVRFEITLYPCLRKLDLKFSSETTSHLTKLQLVFLGMVESGRHVMSQALLQIQLDLMFTSCKSSCAPPIIKPFQIDVFTYA